MYSVHTIYNEMSEAGFNFSEYSIQYGAEKAEKLQRER